MGNVGDEFALAKEKLAKDIIGEIVMSDEPDKVIKKWRNIFKISQKKLATQLGITSSVVSDYESGRRKSPGIKLVRKYVEALLTIDNERGGQIIRSFVKQGQPQGVSGAVLDIKEFVKGVSIDEFCKLINADIVVKESPEWAKALYGYTVIDSVRAVTEFSFEELIKLYGLTTQRALIFTKVSTGRTPMVAIKLTNLRPGLVIVHGLDVVDDIAIRIAEAESIPLAVCRLATEEDIIKKLERFKE